MLLHQPAADAVRAAAAAAGVVLGVVLRRAHPRRFEEIQAHFARISAMVQENLRACAWCAPTRRRTREHARFGDAERGVRAARTAGLIRLWGCSTRRMGSCSRPGARARALAGRPRGDRGPHHARPVRGVHRLPRHAQLADGRAGLGGQPVPARRGVVRAHARGARHRRRRSRDRPGAVAGPTARRRDRDPRTSPSATRAPRATALADVSISRARRPHRRASSATPAAGKSTLFQLLPRLLRPAAGHGVRRRASTCATTALAALRAAHRRACRRRRSCSPTTLADNIAYGVAAADERGDRAPRRASPTSTQDVAALPRRLRHRGRRARHHALGRPEAAHRHRPRGAARRRRCCCSTTACRASTRTPRRRSCAGCAGDASAAPR